MILTVTANAAIDKRYVVKNFSVDSVNRVSSCAATAGGKGLNVSRVAALAGEQVTATGFLGGHSGAFIQEHIQAEGVESDFVWCRGESRTCINIWDEAKETQTEFLEPGFSVDQEDQRRLLEKFEERIDQCSLAAISGSVPTGADASLYQKMLEIGEAHHKRIILDTSGSLLEQCLPWKPYLIKPNMDEIRLLTGKPLNRREEILEAAEEIRRGGVSVVVISMGGEGSLISSGEGDFQAIVPKINTVNTVGCGDSMIAGFAVGMERGLPLEECIRLASAISAASAMRLETGYFLKEDVESLLPRIQIQKL